MKRFKWVLISLIAGLILVLAGWLVSKTGSQPENDRIADNAARQAIQSGGDSPSKIRSRERSKAGRTVPSQDVIGSERIRSTYERLGTLDSMEASILLTQVGVNAARSYLLTRPRPLGSFDQMLANALVCRFAKDSIYDALAVADEAGVKSLAEFGYVCSALELKCFLDCDSKAYDFLLNHPLIIARVDASGHLAGLESGVVEMIRDVGLPLKEIKHRFDAFKRPDFLAQVEKWIEGGADSSTFGGDQAMLNELGEFDKRLRLAAAARLGEEGVTPGDYLGKNPWLWGEDRKVYCSNWADCDPGGALEWIAQHDKEQLPLVLRIAWRDKAAVEAWHKKQTDPELRALYLKYSEITRQAVEGR